FQAAAQGAPLDLVGPAGGQPVLVDGVSAGAPMAGAPAGSASPSAAPSVSPSTAPSAAAPSTSPSGAPASPSASRTAGPTPAGTSPAPTPARTASATPRAGSTASVAAYAQQVLDLVNAQRAQNGCGPLTANAKLQSAAQGQSDDMAARSFFDHTNPDGAGPQQRIDATGYHWSTWGENIARGQVDPAAVMDSWMNSPGHRANILNCSFKEIGVGIHLGPGGPWWTQDFGAP
ncbi:CAP domain-containing protein, partial [Kitasatospora nipponensis]|uniref:CAP domain-containing protein n=1 Tax=Kitasatospora nipponensis TaxID=258049 RepID=UPI0031CF3311